MIAYQKEDGLWYVLQDVDKSTKVERSATDEEISEAKEPPAQSEKKAKADK